MIMAAPIDQRQRREMLLAGLFVSASGATCL
jgi:hypothetical protein